jgi:hypothetical protein
MHAHMCMDAISVYQLYTPLKKRANPCGSKAAACTVNCTCAGTVDPVLYPNALVELMYMRWSRNEHRKAIDRVQR